MLYGTLLFQDSMTKPKSLDRKSCDWRYPIQERKEAYGLLDTRAVRACYRSRRISLASLKQQGITSINIQVFAHSADNIIPGAVRLYLWRPYVQGTNTTGFDLYPTQVGNEEFIELSCMPRTIVKGIAVGTVLANTMFEECQICILQPCIGVSVYVSPPGITTGPSIGPAIPESTEQVLEDSFDFNPSLVPN
jgi:hypothetical protein